MIANGCFKELNKILVVKKMSKDQNNASFVYSINLLRLLLSMKCITKEEYVKIVRISAAYYETEKIYV